MTERVLSVAVKVAGFAPRAARTPLTESAARQHNRRPDKRLKKKYLHAAKMFAMFLQAHISKTASTQKLRCRSHAPRVKRLESRTAPRVWWLRRAERTPGNVQYLFNECGSGKCSSKFEQTMYDWWPGYKAVTLLYNKTMGDGSWTVWELLDAASVGMGAAAKGLQLLKGVAPTATAASELSAALNLSEAQIANVARFTSKLPSGNTGVAIDKLGDGILLTSAVPGRVPGSSAVYQKAIDAAGTTTGYWKTTFAPNGSVVHTKIKF